jgi:hypothetical protein
MSLIERIAALHDGSRQITLPLHGDARFEVQWMDAEGFDDFPELDDVEDELADWWLLAAAERGDVLLPILIRKAEPHAVSVFFEGFQPLANDLESFAKKLMRPGQRTPAEVLRAALDEAASAIEARRFASAVATLEENLAAYREAPAAGEHASLRQELARGFTDLGFSWHALGDGAKAALAYEQGAAHGSVAAGMNLLTMHRDAGDWTRARARAESLLSRFKNPEDLTAIRTIYAIALAKLGDAQALQKLTVEHVDYLKWLSGSELEKATALREELVAKLEAASSAPSERALLEPMRAALSQASLVSKLKGPSENDITRALETIEKKQELRFQNWLKSKPALAKEPRVLEAIAALDEPAASKFRAILRSS